MIGSSKNNRENYPRNALEHKNKKPGLSSNPPSKNWAQLYYFETFSRKSSVLTSNSCKSHGCETTPSIQSCSAKFWAWFCTASNFDEGRRGVGGQQHKIVEKIRYIARSVFATIFCLAHVSQKNLRQRGSQRGWGHNWTHKFFVEAWKL